jgi:hypothetical protein
MKEVKPFEEVTIWYRFNHKENVFEHNHIEEGWSSLDAPLPKSENQERGWKGATWKKHVGLLRDGKVTEIGADGVLGVLNKPGDQNEK